MKKILIVSIVILSVFLIYLSTIDRKVYFMVLSSQRKDPLYGEKIKHDLEQKNLLEKYVKNFNGEDYRITDFIKMIQNNKTVFINNKEQSIKNALIKADLLILDIGKVDLFSKLAYEKELNVLYNYVDTIERDLENLFELVRIYCKEDIFILNIYNPNYLFPNEIIDYMNKKIQKLAKKYKIQYLSPSIDHTMIQNTVYLNEKGQKEVYINIKNMLSKTLLNK